MFNPALFVDERINENLRVCLKCESLLRMVTAQDGDCVAIVGHCPSCSQMYLVGLGGSRR